MELRELLDEELDESGYDDGAAEDEESRPCPHCGHDAEPTTVYVWYVRYRCIHCGNTFEYGRA